jgi:hypothetical protein
MNFIWGVILTIFSLFGWLAQVITALSPKTATKWRLTESETDVDPTFYADVRGEAVWDALIIWTLPVAGILFLMNNAFWAYFGLVGGGMYLYFAGRGISTRLIMRRRGIRIGRPSSLKLYFIFLILWGLIALITIMLAITSLSK